MYRALSKSVPPESILEVPLIAPSLNPSFIPMASAPNEVRDKVWARVLYFAASAPELANNPGSRIVEGRLAPLLVSKAFNARTFKSIPCSTLISFSQRIGLPYYYAHIVLPRSLPGASKLASVLSKHPWIGPHVRSLGTGDAHYVCADSMLAILSRTTGLVQFHGNISSDRSYFHYFKTLNNPRLSWNAFETMAKCSGSTLRECHANIGPPKHASALTLTFNKLTALQILTWKCQGDFLNAANPNGLPHLEELRIVLTSSSFLTVLSQMKCALSGRSFWVQYLAG
jgi:hypothetical protein